MNTLQAAHDLARDYNFYLIPLMPPRLGGAAPGKTPFINNWVQEASNNLDTIRAWWGKWPDANIGIVTGRRSQLVVLDVDVDKGGFASLEELRTRVGDIPKHATVRTGSGGLHYYFTYDFSTSIRNSAGRLGRGIDVRGEGGYVVAPPSLHVSNNRYSWMNKNAH